MWALRCWWWRGGGGCAGCGSYLDRVGRGGDVVRAGAFAGVAAGGPLLWQQRPGEVMGTVVKVEEDARGLRVIGRISGRTAAGREAGRALREKAVDGLSFGYRVREARGVSPRELLDLEVVEVSVVTHPMQDLARVIAVE